ncbi:hypothetical protein [Psychroserpens sp.]
MKYKSKEITLNGKGIAIQKSKKSPVSLLNTDNSNNFIFEYEGIVIEIPAGLNDTKLDSLRVTVNVYLKNSYDSVRHTINLFNHTQLEKFISTLSYRLEFSDITIRKAFIILIRELNTYRLDTLSKEPEASKIVYELQDEDRIEAEKFLKSKDLLSKTNNLIGSSGIIGEENNRLLMYLIFTSRKTSKPLHCISFGTSGSGKTHLQSKIAELIPQQDIFDYTQLSANALYYLGKDTLKHKLILIEDFDGVGEALLPLRELQTKGKISKSVTHKGIGGFGTARNLIVEGPVSICGCTTKESIYEDNSNRSFLIYIDESPEQDERIMAYQRLGFAGRIDIDKELQASKLLRNVQQLLKPIRVVNPYAEHLKLPSTVFKPRRTNIHYLQLIELITFYHQFQREEKFDMVSGEAFIETALEDIKLANTLIKDVLLRKSDRLNGVTRDYFENLSLYLKEKNTDVYDNQEIRKELKINEATLRRYHKQLVTEGYIQRISTKIPHEFKVLDVDEFKDLENTIDKALKLCLDIVTSSEVRHMQNDEVNSL